MAPLQPPKKEKGSLWVVYGAYYLRSQRKINENHYNLRLNNYNHRELRELFVPVKNNHCR
jgi:hypothetical protein